MSEALEMSGQKHKVIVLDGLNHLFQRAKTGKVEEYGLLEETISE